MSEPTPTPAVDPRQAAPKPSPTTRTASAPDLNDIRHRSAQRQMHVKPNSTEETSPITVAFTFSKASTSTTSTDAMSSQ